MKKTIQTPTFQNLINDYDHFVKVRNYKTGNSEMYQNVILEFLIWLEESGITKIKNVTSKESVSYFEYLISRPKQRGTGTLAEKTIKFHLFALGLFVLNLLENKEIEKGFFIPSYSNGNQKPRNVLTVSEIKTVYQYCRNEQERALLSVGYGCGLRRSEIEALDVKDIQLSSGMLIVRKGKGNKRREVPMSDKVIEYLKKYIIEERYQLLIGKTVLEDALFVNSKGKRTSGEQLNEILKRMIEQTQQYELIQKEITLHCLRHSIANHLGENNAGIEFIRSFLGHSQINTTYLYAIKNKKRKPVTTF
ncbi:tyrosine-type recombinase/integrase [Flavobacterium sp. ZT3R17]|uniref:tyrosine-type recombinase/integrase n=1 Tax=Flavobacterium cryoconiti TaxID=3398736 RepID=UPI003A842139